MRRFLDAVVPPRCAACAAPAHGLCLPCCRAAEALRLPADGLHLLGPHVAAAGIYAYDGVIRDAIRGMKIGGRWAAARSLAPVIRTHPAIPPAWPVTWVPSTPRRRRQRGCEVPQLLAGPGATPLLRRTQERPDQTSLSPEQRRRSPGGAFTAAGAVPRSVVLVDDVRTTGGTATAAAGALLAAGARGVLVVTLAVGGDDARQARTR